MTWVQSPRKQLDSFIVNAPFDWLHPNGPPKDPLIITIHKKILQVSYTFATCIIQHNQTLKDTYECRERVVALTSLGGWVHHVLRVLAHQSEDHHPIPITTLLISRHSTRGNCTNANIVLGPFFSSFLYKIYQCCATWMVGSHFLTHDMPLVRGITCFVLVDLRSPNSSLTYLLIRL